MIRKPEELTESIREAVDRKAVVLSHIILAVTIAVHTALDPESLPIHIYAAIGVSSALILLILFRFFDLASINNKPKAYLIAYQIIILLGFTFISDPGTPYAVTLFLGVFLMNLYYGSRGVWISVGVFGLTTITKYIYIVTSEPTILMDKLNIIVTFIVFLAVCSIYVNYQKVFDWDRAKLKETEAKLVSSINSLELGFMITDSRPEITMINNTTHELLCGNHSHAALNCPVVTFDFILKKLGASLNIRKVIVDSMSSKQPRSIKSLSFNDRTWSLFVSPIVDNDIVTGTAIVLQDITEEYILERSRDEFFSLASHELRTPLTTIRGNASMVLDQYPKSIKNSDMREMIEDIHNSSERLITIVSDFLDISRLEQGQAVFNIEQLSLREVIDKVLLELKPAIKQKGISVEMGRGLKTNKDLPSILADKRRLTQIMYNLISNAVKFTEVGGVAIDAKVVNNEMIKISVTDTGSGIDAKLQSLLFHKFQQAGESLITRDGTKGTGLGLYASRLLAEGMHGTIKLEKSEIEKGSIFTILMPVATDTRIKKLEHPRSKSTDVDSGMTVEKEAAETALIDQKRKTTV